MQSVDGQTVAVLTCNCGNRLRVPLCDVEVVVVRCKACGERLTWSPRVRVQGRPRSDGNGEKPSSEAKKRKSPVDPEWQWIWRWTAVGLPFAGLVVFIAWCIGEFSVPDDPRERRVRIARPLPPDQPVVVAEKPAEYVPKPYVPPAVPARPKPTTTPTYATYDPGSSLQPKVDFYTGAPVQVMPAADPNSQYASGTIRKPLAVPATRGTVEGANQPRDFFDDLVDFVPPARKPSAGHVAEEPPVPPRPPMKVLPAQLAIPKTDWLRTWVPGTHLPELTIVTSRGDGNHYVKIENWDGGGAVMTLFIRDGERLTVNLPAGEYRLKVATGRNRWYGEQVLFGDDTRCFQADERMIFSVRPGRARESTLYTVQTVELFLQERGNLHTTDIPIENF